MERQPLGIGVIGAGNIVKRHAQAFRSLPALAKLVAVADVDPKRAREAKERFEFEHAYENYAELLGREDVHAVSICTPAGLHTRMVLDAIAAGKHVLCEKPLATTLADTDDIIAAADQHPDQTVCGVFQLRADPTHRRMRWLIGEGHLGRVLLARLCVRVRKQSSYFAGGGGRGTWKVDGGGVVMNQAIHQLDALLTFLGEPVEVSATMDTLVHPIETEDTLTGWVRFESGARATIECTSCAKKKEFSIDVLGENAGMRVAGDPDSHHFDWRIDAMGSAARKALQSTGYRQVPEPRDPKSAVMTIQKLMAKLRWREWNPPVHWGHTPFVQEFLQAASAKQPGPVPPREARRTIALATALYESARTGRSVQWPVDQRSGLYHGVGAAKESPAPHQEKVHAR